MNDPTLANTKLDEYFHVCAFFHSRDEEYDVLGSFYREGLEWGEKELHICDASQCDDHRKRLRSSGIDVDGAEQRGQLQVLPADAVYLEHGVFDQDRMLRTVDEVIAAGLASGFPRSRIMGNMGWALDSTKLSEQLVEYEARVNEVLARNRHPAVCVYDVNRLSGKMMMDILRCHPLALVGGVVQRNPFFTPPERMLEELRVRKSALLS